MRLSVKPTLESCAHPLTEKRIGGRKEGEVFLSFNHEFFVCGNRDLGLSFFAKGGAERGLHTRGQVMLLATLRYPALARILKEIREKEKAVQGLIIREIKSQGNQVDFYD